MCSLAARVCAAVVVCGLGVAVVGCGGTTPSPGEPSQSQVDAQKATADYYKANPPNKSVNRRR